MKIKDSDIEKEQNTVLFKMTRTNKGSQFIKWFGKFPDIEYRKICYVYTLP